MCEIHKEKLISCQLGYYPLGKVEYNLDIDKVIKIIKNSNLSYEVGDFSTVIKGESTEVFGILNEITKYSNGDFIININISNT